MPDQAYRSAVEEALQRIAGAPASLFRHSLSRQDLVKSGTRTLETLGRDMARIRDDAGVIFATATGDQAAMAGHDLAHLFTKWRRKPPSTVALILVAAAHFGIAPDNEKLQAAIMAGLAAEVTLDNPYHNNSHFREVTTMMARFCNMNNLLARQGDARTLLLTPDDIALCLTAAAAHDLLHTGKSNSPDGPGSHQQYLLERQSVAALAPFLALAHLPVAEGARLETMILITDATADEGKKAPHKILRQIVETADGNPPADAAPVPPELEPLVHDRKLRVMASLMSDSDLGPSAGTNYLFNKEQSRILHEELPFVTPTDASAIGFLDFMMERKFLSPAAQAIAQYAMTDIFTKATNRHDAPVNAGLTRRTPAARKPPRP